MADSKKVIEILTKISEQIQMEKDFLTELDNVIGDGDHGINMARGFKEVEKKLAGMEGKDIGSILKAVGMALVSTVGGASGPLYGTAFMKAGAAVGAKSELSRDDFVAALEAAIGGIEMRGKATKGEKTMLDALIPALDALKSTDDIKEGLDKAVKAAEDGVAYTKTIIATKGRASYLGERSIGHQDPGATSSLLILKVISASL